jgi:alcohol dehydrogenase class IV
MKSFAIAATPQLHFGAGKISNLPTTIKTFGSKVLLITGSKSFSRSKHFENLLEQLHSNKIVCEQCTTPFEPTPDLIDKAVQKFAQYDADTVVAIGGGSVLDAGKAISAMLHLHQPVKNYLEGVGIPSDHPGVKVPFIAVPTTSGTGSEATKNAVLSEIGENGYKKSLRHNNFVPNVAVIDPELTLSCPPDITASSGMDAFTQLLESYLSTAANPFTDALALQGLTNVSSSLKKAYHHGADIESRTGMALASYLSGITLANAGLGLVHGFASSVGGYYPISHGIICSTLMAASNKITVRKLRSNEIDSGALSKYATVGKIFARHDEKSDSFYIDFLLDLIEDWSKEMRIPTLTQCGVKEVDHKKIVSNTENKNNPILLNHDEMIEVLQMAG